MIAEGLVLAFFDVDLPTVVAADSSSYGLVAVLMQKHGETVKPVSFCSRILTPTEQRWAQIEKECLASVWACEKFHPFVCVLQSFRLQTDHKPLVPLINSKDLHETPLRCQRLLMRLMRYSPVAAHVPGRFLTTADVLSRHPMEKNDESYESSPMTNGVETHVEAVVAALPAKDGRLKQSKSKQMEDNQLSKVIDCTNNGWPDSPEDDVAAYYHSRGDLSITDDLLMLRSRIVIPPALKDDILERLHEGNVSLGKAREKAKNAVWWPTLSTDLNRLVQGCSFCQTHRRAQKAEPMLRGLPELPWQQIGMDLCEYEGKTYLVTVDHFSRWIELDQLTQNSDVQCQRRQIADKAVHQVEGPRGSALRRRSPVHLSRIQDVHRQVWLLSYPVRPVLSVRPVPVLSTTKWCSRASGTDCQEDSGPKRRSPGNDGLQGNTD